MTQIFTRRARLQFLSELEGLRGGGLTLRTPEGERHSFGEATGPQTDLHLRDWSLLPALAVSGDIALGEGYVAGLWDSEDPEALLQLLIRNSDGLSRYARQSPLTRLALTLSDRMLRPNSLRGAARNIRAHYDVGNEFYQLWLDPGMTYSSGIFLQGDDLTAAQSRKNERILSLLPDGERILEIGCGWGGFAEAAADRGRHVTGLTLSPSQAGYADARLDGRAEIRLQDYRRCGGQFDNIVSVEMIEAVGERWWPVYFATIRDRLREGGRAVIQAITVPDEQFSVYRERSDFIRRHIFPGGLLPCHSALTHAAGAAGLQLNSRFAFGQDYAKTCRIWAERLQARLPQIRRLGHDERFLRSWRYYLLGCAATFATGRTDVVQLEFAHRGTA